MCLLCIEVAKGKMSAREVGKALIEFKVPEDHEEELLEAISQYYSEDDLFQPLLEDNFKEVINQISEEDDFNFYPYADDYDWDQE